MMKELHLMEQKKYLSLCIPTNGIIEWVIPVLNSIYQNCQRTERFEIVVTDNGNNSEFETEMRKFEDRWDNFVYQKTNAVMFLNQIEAFRLAKGELIKFVNHRMMFVPGAVDYLIDFAERNIERKPVVYFSNGVLNLKGGEQICNSFDAFVQTLSYYSSWSAGTAIWKEHLRKIRMDQDFNTLFPHTDLIFSNRHCGQYIVDDRVLMREIPGDITKKGNYDLFKAFAVEYPMILKSLLQSKDISQSTYESVLKENRKFVSRLYYDYVIRRRPCSYSLKDCHKTIGIIYSRFEIWIDIQKIIRDSVKRKLEK